MKIAFDFDGTLVNINSLHALAWERVLIQARLPNSINEIFSKSELPTIGRYDSYERISQTLLTEPNIKILLDNIDVVQDKRAQKLMDLKVAYLLEIIEQHKSTELYEKLSMNCATLIDRLLEKDNELLIVSSTRESIVRSLLLKVGLDSAFNGIFGESSMTDEKGILHDKPDPYVVMHKSILQGCKYYIGDNGNSDRGFAKNIDAEYLHYIWGNNMLDFEKEIV